jgi:hypothetical protein
MTGFKLPNLISPAGLIFLSYVILAASGRIPVSGWHFVLAAGIFLVLQISYDVWLAALARLDKPVEETNEAAPIVAHAEG